MPFVPVDINSIQLDGAPPAQGGFVPVDINSIKLDAPKANAQQEQTFLGGMAQNFGNAIGAIGDLSSGNFEDFGKRQETPKTQALGDKLFPQGYQGGALEALANIKNTSLSDWSGALLEKFGNSPEGKALSVIGGLHPLYNAVGTAWGQYVNPAIEQATGIHPDNLALAELGLSALGVKGASKVKDPLVSFFKKGEAVPKAQSRAQALLNDALEADNLSSKNIASRLSSASKDNPDVVAIDVAEKNIGGLPIAGRNLQALADAAANMPGKAASIAGQTATRKMSQTSRISNYLDSSLGKEGYYDIADNVIANIDLKANAAREKALAYPENITNPELSDLLSRPAGKRALSFAKTMAADAGIKVGFPEDIITEVPSAILNSEGQPFSTTKTQSKINGYNTRALDWTKRALDQMINSTEGKNQITGRMTEQGKLWVEIKNKISDSIKTQNPDYRDWMKTYADEAQRKTALDAGRSFISKDPEQIQRVFGGYSKPEKQAYLIGVKRELLDKIKGAGDNADAVKRIWNETTRSRLSKIMDQVSFNKLSKQMELERRMVATDQRNLGNSATMRRQEYADKIRSDLSKEDNAITALKALVSPAGAAKDLAARGISRTIRKGVRKLDEDTAHELMKILYTKDPKKINPSSPNKSKMSALNKIKDTPYFIRPFNPQENKEP